MKTTLYDFKSSLTGGHVTLTIEDRYHAPKYISIDYEDLVQKLSDMGVDVDDEELEIDESTIDLALLILRDEQNE